MSTELRLTIPEVADSIERTEGVRYTDWKIRRAVDRLNSSGVISIQRMGLYRTVAASEVSLILNSLRERGVVNA